MMSICLGLPGYNFDEPSSKVSSRTSLFCTLDFSHVREKKLLYVGFRCATCLLRLWWCGWKACMPIYRGLRKRVTILFHGLTYCKLSWYSNLFQHCLRNNNILYVRGFRLWSPSFCPLFPSIALPSGFFVNSLPYHFTGAWEFTPHGNEVRRSISIHSTFASNFGELTLVILNHIHMGWVILSSLNCRVSGTMVNHILWKKD